MANMQTNCLATDFMGFTVAPLNLTWHALCTSYIALHYRKKTFILLGSNNSFPTLGIRKDLLMQSATESIQVMLCQNRCCCSGVMLLCCIQFSGYTLATSSVPCILSSRQFLPIYTGWHVIWCYWMCGFLLGKCAIGFSWDGPEQDCTNAN